MKNTNKNNKNAPRGAKNNRNRRTPAQVKASAQNRKTKGVFAEGVLRGNRRGFAFLLRENGDLFIPHKGLHGAMHGDRVKARVTGNEGEVVEILERGYTSLVGVLRLVGASGVVSPDDKDFFEEVSVSEKQLHNALNGDKVVVNLTYTADGITGEVVENLGQAGVPSVEVLAIARSYGFSQTFPGAVLAQAAKVASMPVTPSGRKDLRGLLTVTIDGDDAKDFDDAISVEETDGGFLLYVHIADVSEYVAEGTALDREALARSTSVYIPTNTLPMLPEILSNGCCSLRPDEDRYALSAKLRYNKNGDRTGAEFFESVIRSDARLTYCGAAEMLDKGDESAVGKMLCSAEKLSDLLKAKRAAEGCVEFSQDEVKVVLRDGKLADLVRYPVFRTNNIIEEFMLQANEAVAEFTSSREYPSIYRVHEKPTTEKLSALSELSQRCGVPFSGADTPLELRDYLESLHGLPVERLLNSVALRCMQKAKYSPVNGGHYGLAKDNYCHFTSPIRREPDLFVHRVLKSVLRKEIESKKARYTAESAERAAVASEREVAAEKAERDADDYFRALFMQDKVGVRFKGIVSGVTQFGLFVLLDNTVEGLVRISDAGYRCSSEDFRAVLAGDSYALGDDVEIEVEGVSLAERSVYFLLCKDGEPIRGNRQQGQPSERKKPAQGAADEARRGSKNGQNGGASQARTSGNNGATQRKSTGNSQRNGGQHRNGGTGRSTSAGNAKPRKKPR